MIDLRSDTVTHPTDAMRKAAMTAEVGDDVLRDDPTVAELERKTADILGMEAGLYVPSGTMGNQVAAMTQTEPGEEVIVETKSHIYTNEVGGLSALGGVQPRPIRGDDRGRLPEDAVAEAIHPASLHRPGTGLVCLENTHNQAGGCVLEPDDIERVAAIAHRNDVPVHLDGARLWNAAVALGVSESTFTDAVDSVMVSFSKGLGAPVGSLLAGSAEFIEDARRSRKRLGGGMRQAGIIAAPALEALEERDRLDVDHNNATRLAAGLDDLDGITAASPETNIVLLDLTASSYTGPAFAEAAENAGVGCIAFGPNTVRCCTHKDITDADIEEVIDRFADMIGS